MSGPRPIRSEARPARSEAGPAPSQPPPAPFTLRPARFGPPEHTTDTFEVHLDCRHYDGAYPCRLWRPCHGCDSYDPVGGRVLIVLLEALGDVLITSPLPARIKRDQPDAHITWLVYRRCAPLVAMNPYVDRVLEYGWETVYQLQGESYDLVLGLERVAAAATLVERISARRKAGIARGGPHNALYPMDEASREILMLDTWNDYRTHWNTSTWTELYFRVAGFRYEGEPYVLRIPPAVDRRVARLLGGPGAAPRICLNLGGSFVQKVWPDRHWATVARHLLDRGMGVILGGGEQEHARCAALHRALTADYPEPGRVVYEPLSLEEFCAVPRYTAAMVTGDSFGFHVALAGEQPCVVLFGPSNPAEVLPKHVGNVRILRSTFACSPCAHQMTCHGVGGCMDVIDPADVLRELDELLARPALPAQVR